jgi:hypothetical protein
MGTFAVVCEFHREHIAVRTERPSLIFRVPTYWTRHHILKEWNLNTSNTNLKSMLCSSNVAILCSWMLHNKHSNLACSSQITRAVHSAVHTINKALHLVCSKLVTSPHAWNCCPKHFWRYVSPLAGNLMEDKSHVCTHITWSLLR